MAFDIGMFANIMSSLAPLLGSIQDYKTGKQNTALKLKQNELDTNLKNAQLNNQNVQSEYYNSLMQMLGKNNNTNELDKAQDFKEFYNSNKKYKMY